MEHKKKVYVAMSGGVDSSVSATLLKEAGYDVTGVFMDVWQPDFIECSKGDDRREAMRVAAHLGIPFKVVDLQDAYKKHVVDYMISEYKKGRTPNPDIMCNKHIKFGLFFKHAMDEGADYIATGHYVRTNEKGELLKGVDDGKDQSYFLWTLKKEHLLKTLFPVGELLKKEVRKKAEAFSLPNAQRKESQGVCFMGEFDMKEFLSHYIPKEKGDVLNEDGEVIGYHDGSHFLTLGQRHGFTITKKTPDDKPYYVLSKDVEKNTITVSSKEAQEKTAVSDIFIEDVSFISGEESDESSEYTARIRYRQPVSECSIKKEGDDIYKVTFKKPQIAVAEGQSVVLYDGDVCCGGGVIKK